MHEGLLFLSNCHHFVLFSRDFKFSLGRPLHAPLSKKLHVFIGVWVIMDGLYYIFRFSKYLTKILAFLVISLLIFIYFITLNGTQSEDIAFDGASSEASSLNRKMLLSTLEGRVERDEYSVNKGKER